ERVLEPSEHLVERLAKALELVVGLRNRQPLAGGLRRDLGRTAAHRLDRAERDTRERVPRQRREQERNRARGEGLVTEARERLGPVLTGRPDDEHKAMTAALDRRCEQPGRLVQPGHRLPRGGEGLAAGSGELGRAEERALPELTRRLQHPAALVHELRVALA